MILSSGRIDRILRVKRHRGDVGMPSRILGAMSVLVTCPAADKLFVIANARRNCWPLWEAIPGPVTHRPDPSSQKSSRLRSALTVDPRCHDRAGDLSRCRHALRDRQWTPQLLTAVRLDNRACDASTSSFESNAIEVRVGMSSWILVP